MPIDTPRRRFFFSPSEYHLPHTGKERNQAKRIIAYGIKNNRSPTDVLESLKGKGLGYRKKNFLNDYAKAHATEFSKTRLKYERAKVFFGGVEKIKKRDKIRNYPQAIKKLLEYRKLLDSGQYSTEDLKQLQKLQIDEREIFGWSSIS